MPYDNSGAHDAVRQIMRKGENLNAKFGTDKDGYPYGWLETPRTKGFKYRTDRINPTGFIWVYTYLNTGKDEDFGVNPEEVEPFKEGEDNNFQLMVFKGLVESGKQMQFVPQFRETSGYISATAKFKKGEIFFRLERTPELVEYLQEKGLI